MAAVFVDTGALYAAADTSDRHHAAAAATFAHRAPIGDLVTSDHVFVETWCLMRARLSRPHAMRFWDSMATGVVGLLGVTAADLARARAIARAWPDQDFSLVDCTSFAVIERNGIEEVFAFDTDFHVFRAGPRRDRPLRVIP